MASFLQFKQISGETWLWTVDFISFWNPGIVFTEYYSENIMYKFLRLQCNMTCYTLLPEKYKLWKETVITVKRLENKHSIMVQVETAWESQLYESFTYKYISDSCNIFFDTKAIKNISNLQWPTLDHLAVKSSETCDRCFLKNLPMLDQQLNTLHCLGMKTSEKRKCTILTHFRNTNKLVG